MKRAYFTCLLAIFIKCVNSQSAQERFCQTFRTCDSCVQAESYCVWCFQEEFKNDRCGPPESLKRFGCKSENTIKSDGETNIVEVVDEDFKDVTISDDIEESIQIRPQKLSVQLRAKQPLNFQFTYRPAENYPLDLYYLMDLTETMSYDIATMATLGTELAILLQKLSKNFKVAFGYYSDKVAMPFSKMTNESLRNPCDVAGKTCEKAFDFVHRLNFTNNVTEFISTINASKTTSNLDNLEGGMDALIQIILCADHIHWRQNSRKIIVVATDGILHFAGDGILAGAVRRNPDKCLLNQDGYYDQSLVYDYPSLEEIYRRLLKHKMNVLFAAKEDALSYYTKLNEAIPTVTFIGKLAEKSINVLKLVTDGYFNIVKNAHFTTKSDNVKVTFKTNCNKHSGWNISSECDNIEVGKEYVFDVTLEVDKVPDKILKETLVIEEKNIAEKLIIDVEYIGMCKCKVSDDSDDCSGNGVHKCGICECSEGWKGDKCEVSCMNWDVDECREKNETYTSSTCYGRGDCDCGKCFCDEAFTGKFCQDRQCVMNRYGEVCSGFGQGICQDGKCLCRDGFSGDDCSCITSKKSCIAPGSTNICSGAGTCTCGKCKCKPNYSGEYCEICATCTGLCSNYENCVLDTVNQAKNTNSCRTEDGNLFITRLVNSSISVDSSTCYIRHEKEGGFICDAQFRYTIKDNDVVDLEIHDDCGKPVQAGTLIGIIIAAVLGIGIILILAWKAKLMYADRREYARFLEETQRSKMLEVNPLYNSPIRTYEMPRELQTFSSS